MKLFHKEVKTIVGHLLTKSEADARSGNQQIAQSAAERLLTLHILHHVITLVPENVWNEITVNAPESYIDLNAPLSDATDADIKTAQEKQANMEAEKENAGEQASLWDKTKSAFGLN